MSQKSDYYKNRGDASGRKIGVGMEAAERDGYQFVAETAIALGAQREHVEQLGAAIASDPRVKYLGIAGYLYLIDSDSTEMIGYTSALREMQDAVDNAKWFAQAQDE